MQMRGENILKHVILYIGKTWQGKITKLNSTNINPPQFRPAGRPPEYIQLSTVPVLQDSSREHDVGDSSLSGKRICVTNEVHSWGSRPRPIGPTSSVSPQSTLERARMGRCVDENVPAKAFSQLEIASYQDLINHEAWLTL